MYHRVQSMVKSVNYLIHKQRTQIWIPSICMESRTWQFVPTILVRENKDKCISGACKSVRHAACMSYMFNRDCLKKECSSGFLYPVSSAWPWNYIHTSKLLTDTLILKIS